MSATRSSLISLLSEACELEHGLACSYLFAAFSLKTEISDGVDSRQQRTTRLWASQIYMVAAEEMLHLAQAWNMLAAVGGSPYYLRPNFPQSRTYYGFHQPLKLEPFGLKSLERFIHYETPAALLRPKAEAAAAGDETAKFRSVGELYGLIGEQIDELVEAQLFFAGSQGEMGPKDVHFPAIVAVTDAKSAHAAIKLITEQGEGIATKRQNSHYDTFLRMKADLEKELAADPGFFPSRPVVENPVARRRDDWAGHGHVHVLKNHFAKHVCDLFDDSYTLMLRLLQHAFAQGPGAPATALFAGAAIDAMATVIKPLGEALTLLPADHSPDLRAGASFGLTRHVPLPPRPDIAVVVAAERADELHVIAAKLAADAAAPAPLKAAAANIARIAGVLKHGFAAS
jgi:Ferritin-like